MVTDHKEFTPCVMSTYCRGVMVMRVELPLPGGERDIQGALGQACPLQALLLNQNQLFSKAGADDDYTACPAPILVTPASSLGASMILILRQNAAAAHVDRRYRRHLKADANE